MDAPGGPQLMRRPYSVTRMEALRPTIGGSANHLRTRPMGVGQTGDARMWGFVHRSGSAGGGGPGPTIGSRASIGRSGCRVPQEQKRVQKKGGGGAAGE